MSLELRVKGAAKSVNMKRRRKEPGCDLAGNSSHPLLVAKGLRGQARSRGASADSWMLQGLTPGWGEEWLPDSRGRLEPPAPGAVTWPRGSSLPYPPGLSSSAVCFCLSWTVAR